MLDDCQRQLLKSVFVRQQGVFSHRGRGQAHGRRPSPEKVHGQRFLGREAKPMWVNPPCDTIECQLDVSLGNIKSGRTIGNGKVVHIEWTVDIWWSLSSHCINSPLFLPLPLLSLYSCVFFLFLINAFILFLFLLFFWCGLIFCSYILVSL